MRKVVFENNGLEDLTYWAKIDLKILKKIIILSENTAQTPFEGLGKPEPLYKAIGLDELPMNIA